MNEKEGKRVCKLWVPNKARLAILILEKKLIKNSLKGKNQNGMLYTGLRKVNSSRSSVQVSRSVVSDSLRSHGMQHTRPPSPWSSQSLLKLMSNESVMPSNHLILCRPLLFLPSIFPSTRVFSNESALRIRWPKY